MRNSAPEGLEANPFENVAPIRPLGHAVSAEQANAFNQKESGNLSVFLQRVMDTSNLDVRWKNTPPVGAQASGAEMAEPTREEIKAEIAASEARAATKIAELTGELRTLNASLGAKIDAVGEKVGTDIDYNRATRWVMVGLIITVAFALAGLIVAMATYGDALFGRGMDVHDLIQATVKETLAGVKH